MRLDYSSLKQPVTSDDIRRYAANEKPLSINITASLMTGLWLIVWVPGFLGAVSSGKGLNPTILLSPLVSGIIFAGVTAAVIYGSGVGIKQRAKMKRFAEQNGATYSQDVAEPSMTGMIFDNGHSGVLNESLAFENGMEVGNYTYVTGSGKYRASHQFSFIRVALSRNLPHMVLDAKSNNFFGSSLPDAFGQDQRLSLEGDFDKYFDVYAPAGYATDALYVFTPDVMQTLIDEGTKYDMEIVGNELFIFKRGAFNLTSENQLSELLSIAGTIAEELKDQTRRYIDERAGDRPTVGEAVVGVPEVAVQGRRLKQRSPFLALIFFALLVNAVVVPAILPQDIATVFVVIAWPAVLLFTVGWVLANFVRSR